MAKRLEAMGQQKYMGTTKTVNGKAVWTGKINFDENALLLPLKWKKPQRIFVNSMSDLFHESVSFEVVDKALAVMALTPHHTYQILTKRPERAAEYLNAGDLGHRIYKVVTNWLDDGESGILGSQWDRVHDLAGAAAHGGVYEWTRWKLPLENLWLGTSCEDQQRADERIPHLLRCPAAVRFLSVEPLIGPVSLRSGIYGDITNPNGPPRGTTLEGIHQVIVGAESGPSRRPMKIEWARSLRDQCKAAGVAFFMKQLEVGGKITGDIENFPEDLRVREFPKAGVLK